MTTRGHAWTGRGSPHLIPMRAALILSVVLAAAPLSASAQHWTPEPVPGAGMADQHRWEMERLRAEADRQAAFAARQQLETELALMRLEAARRPALPAAPQNSLPGSLPGGLPVGVTIGSTPRPGETSQIDAWLDRAPRR